MYVRFNEVCVYKSTLDTNILYYCYEFYELYWGCELSLTIEPPPPSDILGTVEHIRARIVV